MRRRLLLTAALTLSLATVVAVTQAAGGTGTKAHQSRHHVLRFSGTPTGGGAVDNDPQGPSIGDQFLGHGTVKEIGGHRKGRFFLTTELVAGKPPHHASERSTFDLTLRGGELVIAGTHASIGHYAMAVLGGTGRFSGASGEAAFAPGKHGTTRLTIRLRG